MDEVNGALLLDLMKKQNEAIKDVVTLIGQLTTLVNNVDQRVTLLNELMKMKDALPRAN